MVHLQVYPASYSQYCRLFGRERAYYPNFPFDLIEDALSYNQSCSQTLFT